MTEASPQRTFRLTLEYDGSSFSGWQRQKDQVTVQGVLEQALTTILDQPVTVSGSGRTDAGVHALGQVASFTARTRLDGQTLRKGLNSLMREPVVVLECDTASPDFHAQYSAVSKTYQYRLLNQPIPCAVGRQYVWHLRNPLDIDVMNQCCRILVGTHDFKSFENTGSPRRSTVRQIFRADVARDGEHKISFTIRASGFLKYMVRNITGTLVQAGLGKIGPERFGRILAARDRTQAGPTAPPQGLFLLKVYYS